MVQQELKSNSQILPRRSLLPLQASEIRSLIEENQRQLSGQLVKNRWRSSIKIPKNAEVNNYEQDYEDSQDNIESRSAILNIEKLRHSNGKPLNQQPAYDKLINTE